MSTALTETEPRGFRAKGTTFMVSGGLAGAIGAYLFQVYGANALGSEAFAPIGLLWTAFFILATVALVPIEQYVTREVASGHKAIPAAAWATYLVVLGGAGVAGLFVVFTFAEFEQDWQYILQAALLVVGYGLLFFGKGVLAG
ncbi:MAG: hypothetical protein OEM39_02330, partial [Acidimicrobiia bacterium]|nr:hypothetical protein [Acidimicrobiia bacterium]